MCFFRAIVETPNYPRPLKICGRPANDRFGRYIYGARGAIGLLSRILPPPPAAAISFLRRFSPPTPASNSMASSASDGRDYGGNDDTVEEEEPVGPPSPICFSFAMAATMPSIVLVCTSSSSVVIYRRTPSHCSSPMMFSAVRTATNATLHEEDGEDERVAETHRAACTRFDPNP